MALIIMNEQGAFIRIFCRLSADERISVWHFAVYMCFVHKWLTGGLANPIAISRKEVMQRSHIASIVTYHKCIKQLEAFDYIIYEPSYNPFTGSSIYLLVTG